ncbi:hypothetical protein [Streptomyces sp. NPDC057909]|uniref:hypothetical protein n=1 Tax=Streptomyces sp. NPDC057909 TaxID=3346277 RepID=UPI0036E4B942
MTPEPIAAIELFRTVMAAANGRCQCAGECGQPHTQSQQRCPRQHGWQAPLVAAPADPATPDRIAVTLPAGSLRAWCSTCFTAAQRLTQRSSAHTPAADQQALFDL